MLGTAFNMGKDLAGTAVHIVYDNTTVMFFDAHGTEIITHPIPVKGTRYVGNGKPGLPNATWPNPAVYDALGVGVQGLLTGQTTVDSVLEEMDAAWDQ